MPDPARNPWGAVILEVPHEHEDEVAGGLAWFGLGARVRPADAGHSRIEVYLHSPARARAALDSVAGLLARAGLDARRCGLRVEQVEDERWVETYQAALTPFPLGERFVVHPTGRATAAVAGRTPLLLIPGRAFGTGEHPTTRMCAEALERQVRPGSAWLDVGCGSGILSVVARHCGAGRVLALDLDPEAIAVTAEVVGANGAADRVSWRQGSAAEAPAAAWDGVVSNINAPVLLEAMATLAGLLQDGGCLVLSGFLVEDLPSMDAAVRAAGLARIEPAQSPPWASLTAWTR